MQAAYSLNSNELNINFVNSIKEIFKNTDSDVDEYRKSISN